MSIALLLLLVDIAASAYVTLASWNLKNFARGSRSDVEIALVALGVARYDLVALQEIRTDGVGLEKMRDILMSEFGLSFDLYVSDPIGEGQSVCEAERTSLTTRARARERRKGTIRIHVALGQVLAAARRLQVCRPFRRRRFPPSGR